MSKNPQPLKRYNLGLTKVSPNQRDEFRRLSRPDTFMEIRPAQIGQPTAYRVEMTQPEYERALRVAADPNSNLHTINPDKLRHPMGTAYPLPGSSAIDFLAMAGASVRGLAGGNAVVAVIDSGLSPTVGATMGDRIKASRIYNVAGTSHTTALSDDYEGTHGSQMSSIALPPTGRLVIGGAPGWQLSTLIALIYWAVDVAGVDVMSLSYGLINDPDPLENQAVEHAKQQNVIVMAARGNHGTTDPMNPASYPHTYAISNFNSSNGAIADTSAYGDVWAASCGLFTYRLMGDGSFADTAGGGTSAATALAANIATRLCGKGYSKGNVISRMASSARNLGYSSAKQGNGLLQLLATDSSITSDKPNKTNLDGTTSPGRDGC